MPKLKLTRLNDHIVRPIPKLKGTGKPVKGADIFSLYCNIFICSQKFSGKTSLIFNIIKDTTNRNCTIVAFVSTLYKDDSWTYIMEYCDKHKIPFIGHTSLYDDEDTKLDKLDVLVKHLKSQQEGGEEDEEKEQEEIQDKRSRQLGGKLFDQQLEIDEEDAKPRKSRSKFEVPEYLFIFDDLSAEIKNSPSVLSLLKDSTHIHAKMIISSQSWVDVPKSGRGNIDYLILFKNVPEEKLIEMYKENAIASVTLDQFLELYKWATKEQYQFLYFDKFNGQFRKNFNVGLTVKN